MEQGRDTDGILDESLLWRWEEDGVVTELVARELEQGPGDDPETGCQPSQSKKPGGSGKGALETPKRRGLGMGGQGEA